MASVHSCCGLPGVTLRARVFAVGLASSLVAFGYALYFLFKTLVLGDAVPGFPTLIVVVLMLGGLQLLAIGVLGEYLGRLSLESKRRPLYLVEDYAPASNLAGRHTLPATTPP